ncbi:MAG: serine hydrolase domain-containing protein [Paraglaciecola chathamensis]
MKNITRLVSVLLLFILNTYAFADTPKIISLEGKLKSLIPANEPGCSVGVFEKGNAIIKKGYGLANAELNIAMSDNNVHRMASVSKQFVAMAVRLLADQGKIELKNDISTYVSDLPDFGAKVSINSIIGHTAGMGDYDLISTYGYPKDFKAEEGALNLKAVSGHPFRVGNEDYLSVSEFHDVVKTLPLVIKPDTEWRYSNMGYIMLAILVEEVSGLTLREYTDKYIFKPLDMNNTFFADNAVELIKNRAYGYAKDESGNYINDMTNLFVVGDGGLHTNISDMQKWNAQFDAPKLGKNPKVFIQEFMLPNSSLPVSPEIGADILYANGQFISKNENGKLVSHSGGWLGANIMYRRYPDNQFMNLVMCSNTSIDVKNIADTIDKWYFSE